VEVVEVPRHNCYEGYMRVIHLLLLQRMVVVQLEVAAAAGYFQLLRRLRERAYTKGYMRYIVGYTGLYGVTSQLRKRAESEREEEKRE
jgi:hypothetical protein